MNLQLSMKERNNGTSSTNGTVCASLEPKCKEWFYYLLLEKVCFNFLLKLANFRNLVVKKNNNSETRKCENKLF